MFGRSLFSQTKGAEKKRLQYQSVKIEGGKSECWYCQENRILDLCEKSRALSYISKIEFMKVMQKTGKKLNRMKFYAFCPTKIGLYNHLNLTQYTLYYFSTTTKRCCLFTFLLIFSLLLECHLKLNG